VCILDGSATAVTGGSTSLVLNFCNFDADAVDADAVSFGALYPPACDAENATFPVAASLQAADACTSDACAVTVTLERGLDWALALHGASGVNALTAQLAADNAKSEVVTVATFQDIAGAAMVGSANSISVCATEIPISASRLSLVKECNIASLCQGAAADTTCTTPLQEDLYIGDVSCDEDNCSGNVTLASSLPCDGSSGSATALIVGVQVATSTSSNYLSVGSMVAATNFSISAADGLDVGSSEIVLTTDTFCEATSVELSLVYGDSSSSGATIDVSSLNTTTNGTVVVDLASPLTSSFEAQEVAFSLTQCGVSSSTFTATVGAGSDSSVEDEEDESASDGSEDSPAAGTDAGTGSESTAQESDSSAGLSGGLYVGIAIGVLALLGFVGECVIHKRRQAQQPSAANPANATIGYANTM
jgi:hypothetical protein